MALRVYFDTDVVLDLVSGVEEQANIDKIGGALDDGRLICVCSELTIIEGLVHAVRTKNAGFEQAVRGFLASSPKVALIPVSAQVLELGLALRASTNLKTPDAIHIATGQMTNCNYFMTRDRDWARAGVPTLTADGLVGLL
ncbi:MAG: type II toxin-antitoxin system VapC family toxin [Fimbriimonadales bacterium]